MTVKNVSISESGRSKTITWEMTGNYAFVYADDQLLEGPLAMGALTWTGRVPTDAILQVVDSATAEPTPPPTDPVPKRNMLLKWYAVDDIDVASYELYVDGNLVVTRPTGEPFYEYLTPRLESGDHTYYVKSVDVAGNRSDVSSLTVTIGEIPPPTSNIQVTQDTAGSGSFNLSWTAPSGW